MNILSCTPEDLKGIFELYEYATNHQKSKKTVAVWPAFEKSLVQNAIAEKRQWKLLVEEEMACVWTITFTDPQIWEEKNDDPAIYIHRIATHPHFRGNYYVKDIITWAKSYAKTQQKRFIRLDTVGNNEKLIAYYTKAGFTFLGMFTLKNTDQLPAHYQDGPACLFEIDLGNDERSAPAK
ncbi:MAG: GNAT family N-acetyltransferase [Thermonemataceae bacterium]